MKLIDISVWYIIIIHIERVEKFSPIGANIELEMDPLDDEIFRKPAVSMCVNVTIDEVTTYTISVGEGTQSFKWLASVVTNKRGPKKDTVVAGFRNQQGELLNPLDKIIEHSYKHQLTVKADIVPCIPIDEHGDPVLTEWQQVAYVSTSYGQQWHEETAAWRERVKDSVYHEMQNNYEGGGSRSGPGSSLIQIGEFTEKDLDSAFALDWSKITVPGADPTDNTDTIRALLRQSYDVLCKLFIHYCGFGQVGHRYGMSMLEFGHFLHLTLLIPYNSIGDDGSRQTAFESVFLSTVSMPGGNDSKQYPLMSRCEFIEGLLQALVLSRRLREREEAKADDDDDDDGGKDERKSGTGRNYRESGLRQLEIDLKGYLEANVNAFWSSIAATSLLYSSPSAEGVKEAVYHMYQIIKQAFLAYATTPLNHPRLGPGLPTREFENMLEECSLLDSSNSDHMDFLAQAVRHASSPVISPTDSFVNIAAITAEAAASPKTVSTAVTKARWGALPTLCFCEILDCLVKLATISMDAE